MVSNDGARGRAWLAALLLQRQSRLMPRFALALARLRALPRGQRQRLKRRAAATLAGAALVLAIGAASFGPPGAGVAHAATITVANGEIAVNDNGMCSLIEAIINAEDGGLTHDDCAAGMAGADTISLPAGGSFGFSAVYIFDQGKNGLPTIDTEVVIAGNGATLDLNGRGTGMRLARVSSTGDLTVQDATITDGDVWEGGLAGGGVFRVDGGALTIQGGALTDSWAVNYGGAIAGLNGAEITVSAATLSGSIALSGGAVYGRDSDVTLIDCAINDNTGYYLGGAVQVNGGSLTIEGGSITENGWDPGLTGLDPLVEDGGGVFASSATVEIRDAIIDRNGASSSGGGVRLEGVVGAAIIATTITNNSSGVGGGVQWGAFGNSGAYPVTGTIRDSVIDGNRARLGGGGIQMTAYSTLTVERTTISDNTVTYTDSYTTTMGSGGGIANFSSTLTITQSAIHDNSAGVYGGGLYLNNFGGGPTLVTNTTISGNSARRTGGGAFLSIRPNATFNNVTISDNEALDGGGLTAYNSPAYAGTGAVTLNRTIVSGNRAAGYGAEIRTVDATVTANNFNLFGHSGISNGAAFNGFTPGATDITATSDGTQPKALGAILAPLADNGGATLTHALVFGSPAVDIAPDGEATDQRGAPRPYAASYDAGSYEYGATPPTGDNALFVTAAGGSMPGVGPYTKGDILKWDGATWTKWFSSATHLSNSLADLIAFDVADDTQGSAWLTWRQTLGVPGAGRPTGNDITYFDGSSFTPFFDGSDVGLSTTGERIDGLEVRPGSPGCLYELWLSTVAGGSVRNGLNPPIKFTGEDVIRFCLTSVGTNTTGSWMLLEELQSEGLARNNSIDIAADGSGNVIYFLPKVAFTLDGATVRPSQIAAFDRTTRTFSGPVWKAADHGLTQLVDGIDVMGDIP